MITYSNKGAIFSPDRKYRYELRRVWDDAKPFINYIGLNPSRAGEEEDDPTIRREVGFSIAFGYGGMRKYNIFGKVTADPRQLFFPESDPIGPNNDAYLQTIDGLIVIDWGSWGRLDISFELRADAVRLILPKPLFCFGRNKDGEPKHPLYLPIMAKLEKY